MLQPLLPTRVHFPRLNCGRPNMTSLASMSPPPRQRDWSCALDVLLFSHESGYDGSWSRVFLTLGTIGCGADPADPGDTGDSGDPANAAYNPDFMVGAWVADSLVMTSTANSEVVVNLVELGAVFTLSVQPSGRYTGSLQGFGQSSSESGRLTIDGEYVILMPMSPPGPESSALWAREGESEYDFNFDSTDEMATLKQVLSPGQLPRSNRTGGAFHVKHAFLDFLPASKGGPGIGACFT